MDTFCGLSTKQKQTEVQGFRQKEKQKKSLIAVLRLIEQPPPPNTHFRGPRTPQQNPVLLTSVLFLLRSSKLIRQIDWLPRSFSVLSSGLFPCHDQTLWFQCPVTSFHHDFRGILFLNSRKFFSPIWEPQKNLRSNHHSEKNVKHTRFLEMWNRADHTLGWCFFPKHEMRQTRKEIPLASNAKFRTWRWNWRNTLFLFAVPECPKVTIN